MDITYYYQILDIGILYEKGGKKGKRWKIGERKRLREEVLFWQDLFEYISDEKKGIDCSEKLFESLKRLCKKYKFPNYERILEKKDELVNDECKFMGKEDEELKISNLMKQLLLDLQKNIDDYKDKEMVYRILRVLHNLPKSMHGRNIINESCNLISYKDAIMYAQWCMDDRMKETYAAYLECEGLETCKFDADKSGAI